MRIKNIHDFINLLQYIYIIFYNFTITFFSKLILFETLCIYTIYYFLYVTEI